ncbi:MAG: hypothetical protein IKX51_08740 [Bacteroidales bacterium]|nr:hypothetical protein [Bacteroidales bacterium]
MATFRILKKSYRKDGILVMRLQLPLYDCNYPKLQCGYRNNGICLHNETCFLAEHYNRIREQLLIPNS